MSIQNDIPETEETDEDLKNRLNWLSDEALARMTKLDKTNQFKGCLTEMAKQENKDEWHQLWTRQDPDPSSIPYLAQFKAFDRVVFLCHLRPDKVFHALRQFVVECLGKEFLDEEPLDIGR